MQRKAGGPELKSLFTALSERIPQVVWTSDDNGEWTWSSARWTAYTGLTAKASQGTGWYGAIEPGDRAVTEAAWQKATECGVLDVEHRVVGADRSHEARWFVTHAEPLPEVEGRKRLWLGTCTDIQKSKLSELRASEARDNARQRLSDVMSLCGPRRRAAPYRGSLVPAPGQGCGTARPRHPRTRHECGRTQCALDATGAHCGDLGH